MDPRLMKHGMFSWCELLTSDAKASKKFYGTLLGWEWHDLPEMGYSICKAQGEEIGGLMQLTREMKDVPPNWKVFVTVDDVDTTVMKAAELGAKVLVEPTDIPKVGRFCIIKDPQGAVISLIHYRAETERKRRGGAGKASSR